jgi:hypothetical protein
MMMMMAGEEVEVIYMNWMLWQMVVQYLALNTLVVVPLLPMPTAVEEEEVYSSR